MPTLPLLSADHLVRIDNYARRVFDYVNRLEFGILQVQLLAA